MTQITRIKPIVFIFMVGMIILCPLSYAGNSSVSEKEAAYINVKNYVSGHITYRNVLTPEGEFVIAFNPDIA